MRNHTFRFAAAFLLSLALQSAASAGAIKVLFLGAEGDLAQIQAVQADILGTDARFDLVNSSSFESFSENPSLAMLQQYDAVLAWTNFYPTAGYGDLLADYVDGGGHVVLATFHGQEVHQDDSGINGRINSSGYNPLTTPDGNAYIPAELGAYDASSPFMMGVASLTANQYRGDYLPGLDAGATLVASWDDGRPLLAVNGSGNVVAVTLFPNNVVHNHVTGDYQQLFRNALAATAVPEPATIANVAIAGLGSLGLAVAKRRRSSR